MKHGVALADMASFLETKTGQGCLNTNSVTIPVGAGHLVWVPYGWLVVPVSLHPIALKDTETQTEAESVDYGFTFVLNPFVPEWANKVPISAWTAILSFNRAHFDKHKGKALWADRSVAFEKFVKACDAK